jgi:hypothetical protein
VTTVAALYVQPGGVYYGLHDVEPWGLPERDAREYTGPWPVVAHPPCQRWTNLARVNFRRYGGEHNRPGNDDGCFASALAAVRRFGGVLEHPALSRAWPAFGLARPSVGWTAAGPSEWTCEVWQSAYGHRARKATWLLYHGSRPPPDLDWKREPVTHQIGWFDRSKPTLGKAEASRTPPAFRDILIAMAWSANWRVEK